MSQLSFKQANTIAEMAIGSSMGFETETEYVSHLVQAGLNIDEANRVWRNILTVADRSAHFALDYAGLMERAKSNRAKRDEELANRAEAEHRAWCQETGNSF